MQGRIPKIKCCIYEFMTELGLRKSELTVYAFIYAYTKSKYGIYFGKRSYIAESCAISERTVNRVIPKLKRLGLIEAASSQGYRGLRCTELRIPTEEKPEEKKREPLIKREEKYVCQLPTFNTVDVGKGYDSMTTEQINALLKLVSRDTLNDYIIKIEKMLEHNTGDIPPPHSYYKTIKKWIHDDYSV